MVKVLETDKMDGLKGIYSDPPCYLVNEEEPDAFDKKFPAKVKERRPGELEQTR